MEQKQADRATKARPVHEVRLGAVKAAVWRNDAESGTRYNTTFERLYREGETWMSTASFGRDDLLLLAKVADQAHTWIMTEGRESGGAGKSSGDGQPLTGGHLPNRAA